MIDQVAFDVIQEEAPFTTGCVKGMTRACEGESFFREHEGKRYCVLHLPDADKKDAFEVAFARKLDSHDTNFQGVWFPGGNWFTGLEIRQALDFTSTLFNDRTSFQGTAFKSDVKFDGATFNEDARFGGAIFGAKVDFISVTFRKQADFSNARFNGHANFRDCVFNGRVDFGYGAFHKTASFWPATFRATDSFSNASFVSANFRGIKVQGQGRFPLV